MYQGRPDTGLMVDLPEKATSEVDKVDLEASGRLNLLKRTISSEHMLELRSYWAHEEKATKKLQKTTSSYKKATQRLQENTKSYRKVTKKYKKLQKIQKATTSYKSYKKATQKLQKATTS